jgi:hypothetical protein
VAVGIPQYSNDCVGPITFKVSYCLNPVDHPVFNVMKLSTALRKFSLLLSLLELCSFQLFVLKTLGGGHSPKTG